MRACVPALCLLCQVPIVSCLENRGLGEFIQKALGGCASACPPPGPRSAKKPKVSQTEDDTTADLLPLLHRFAVASVVLSGAAQAAAQAKDGVLSNALLCVDVFNHAVDGLLVRVEEYRKFWLMEVGLLSQEREKALEAQSDLLAVSAGQLAACVALGRSALASDDEERVCVAAETAKAMEGLLVVPTRLCAGTRLAVLCDQSAALAYLEKVTRLQRFQVDAARCSVTGKGLTVYANDGVARNVIRVTCMGSDGELADWATLADADVGLTVNGATWQVASAAVPEPGVVEVTYVVEEGLEEMEVGVTLCGVAVPGGPWRPRAGFMAKGVSIAFLPHLRQPYCYSDLTVSSNGSLMVLSNVHTDTLDVYRTEDGSYVRTLGGPHSGPGEFAHPYSLCMTARDTVLVCEERSKCIQEVTLEGAHVKIIPVTFRWRCVAVHGDVMAVLVRGRHDVQLYSYTTDVQLYSYTTGALLRKIRCEDFRNVHGICFAPDGQHLAVGGYRISLLSVDGQSMRVIDQSKFWWGVAFTCMGDVVGICDSGVSVFSVTDGVLLRSWEVEFPSHLAPHARVFGNRLYILNGGVWVFE